MGEGKIFQSEVGSASHNEDLIRVTNKMGVDHGFISDRERAEMSHPVSNSKDKIANPSRVGKFNFSGLSSAIKNKFIDHAENHREKRVIRDSKKSPLKTSNVGELQKKPTMRTQEQADPISTDRNKASITQATPTAQGQKN